MLDGTSRSPSSRSASLPASIFFCFTLGACVSDDVVDGSDEAQLRALDDGLLLHWTFEDSVGTQITDVSGNGRHGTLQGAVLVASPNGQAASLDGVDDWVALTSPPRAPALYGGVDGSFTLSAKVKVGNASKYNTLCVGCGPFSTLYVGTEPYGAALLSALDDQASTGWKWLTSSAALVDDTWTEVTLVVENGGNARYYLDCQADAVLTDANLGLLDVGSSSIGKGATATRWFGGQIDELRIWDRVLTTTEIAELCPGVEIDPLAEGLEMHWTFEDRVGNLITDISGKGHTGTLVGGSFVASGEGEAVSLDGIDDKVTFVGPRALALYGGAQGDFTFSTRVRVPNASKYNTLCVGCGPFSTMYIGDPAPGRRVLSALWNLDTLATAWAASSSMLTNDEWAVITLVVEGGVAARTYKDCTLDSTLGGINVGLRDPGFSALGQGSVAGRWYQGEVDELRVWSRALPDEELALLCPPVSVCDGPIHVDVDAPAGGDGITWGTAFANLQDAINASTACTDPQLWVAEGQYGTGPTTPVATIGHRVAIYGGFSGSEVSLAERDIAAHPVRLGADSWQSRVVKIADADALGFSSVRLDGLTISGSAKGAIEVLPGASIVETVVLDNLTITDNVAAQGAGLYAHASTITVTISNSSFERNQVGTGTGGALDVRGTAVVIENSSFIDNSGRRGGAIYYLDPSGAQQITDTTLRSNDATWGGAIYVDDDPANPAYLQLAVQGGEFEANTASGGGGAVYLEESSCSFDSVAFIDNSGWVGGGIQLGDGSPAVVNDELEISNCRFIGNSTVNGSGGGLRLLEVGTTVINTEFVGNTATTVGGGVYGRGTFIGSTFTTNTAPTGSALYAPAGAAMSMTHVVVYPDTIFGTNIQGNYSCTTSTNLTGPPQTTLADWDGEVFAPADLDLDGRTEWYLLDFPCEGHTGGVITAFDWASMTVDPSQCTDSGWPEPGVHYEPQAAVGACP